MEEETGILRPADPGGESVFRLRVGVGLAWVGKKFEKVGSAKLRIGCTLKRNLFGFVQYYAKMNYCDESIDRCISSMQKCIITMQ